MRVLALDSTTRDGSVALLEIRAAGDAGMQVDERTGDATRTHAERLPSELIALLDAHDLRAADIDLFAVASGPGSFTGLRIGISTMQGFALATAKPLIGVSALDALAAVAPRFSSADDDAPAVGAASTKAGHRCATWIDAYRREVFTNLYRCERHGSFAELEGPRVDDPAATLARWRDADTLPSLFIGSGATLYASAITAVTPSARVVAAPPLAGAVGRLAAARFAAGESPHPAALQPLYVRRPDAELARDKSGIRS